MKKILSVLVVSIFMVSAMSMTAFARGGHGGGHSGGHGGHGGGQGDGGGKANPQPQYTLCTVPGCEEGGAHQHNGTWYCSQTARTGDYSACPLEGCTTLGLHEHDGAYYHCQNHSTQPGCGRSRNR